MIEDDAGMKSVFPRKGGSLSECDAAFDVASKTLSATVTDAAEFFLQNDPHLFDGYQTAFEVLSHLLFWHCEYVAIIQALRNDVQPELRAGTFAELNQVATEEFAGIPVDELANQLLAYQKTFEDELGQITNLLIEFPIKCGGRTKSVRDRVPSIESHIRNHVRRLRSAERHGEEWVKAYYQDN